VAGPIPQMRVQLATALSAGLAFGLITTVLVRLAWRAQRNKVAIGPEALVGAVGVAQEALAPQGQVLVHGELWQAESALPVTAGAKVRVRGVDGLTLQVEPVTAGRAGDAGIREHVSA
jgi:membrane-bound serine protease (ClpP class)